MKVTFRPSRPEDAEALVPLTYSSGPAAFSYVFSHRTRITAQEFLYRTLQQPAGEFGYAVHVTGEINGEIVAGGACYSGELAFPFLTAALRQILGNYGIVQGAGIIRRGLRVEAIVPPPKGKLHYVSHLGVAPEMRGQGIGEQLVHHLLEIGRAAGRTTAALDVSVENPRAQALYERLGFVVTKEYPSRLENDTARVPDHRRMELAL
jgi:ribosomal protein S18 acetylase RimI-like enzyme